MTGLVRVTVAARDESAELAVPAAVPLAELVPDLLRSVGLLDPDVVAGGCRVVTRHGRPLSTARGLADQGIRDGAVLVLRLGAADERASPYDDVLRPPQRRRRAFSRLLWAR